MAVCRVAGAGHNVPLDNPLGLVDAILASTNPGGKSRHIHTWPACVELPRATRACAGNHLQPSSVAVQCVWRVHHVWVVATLPTQAQTRARSTGGYLVRRRCAKTQRGRQRCRGLQITDVDGGGVKGV